MPVSPLDATSDVLQRARKLSDAIEPHEAPAGIRRRLGDLAHRRYVMAELDWIDSFIWATDEVAD